MTGKDLQEYIFRMTTAFLKQQGLCELSEIAETLSIVYAKVFRLYIDLVVSG